MYRLWASRARAINIWLMAPLLGLAGALVVMVSVSAPVAQAATANSTLNFQARLLTSTGGIVPDGNYNIEFKIYKSQSANASAQGVCVGGATDDCLWIETRTGANVVSVVNGYFSVNLGSVNAFSNANTPINWDNQLWLTMRIGGTGTPSWDSEMTNGGNRIQLTGVPLAFRANALAVTGTNEQILQFASTTFGQATTISLPDPGATTATVCYQGSASCGFATGSTGSYIQNQTASLQAANFRIQSAASGSIAAAITGASGQSVDILDVNTNGNANPVLGVNSTGNVVFRAAANSTTAYQIQNSAGANLFSIDSTGSLASANLLANPSFETTISGSGAGVWVIKQGGAGTPTIANNTSFFYNQLNSAKVVTTANTGDGIKQQLNSTLSTSTSYNVVFYAQLDTASAAMNNDLQAGYSSTGASDDTPCSLSISVTASGWTRYSCTFTTPATTNSSNYFYIKQTDSAVHTFYVDAVLLQLSSSADANYRDAKISINGTITSPVIIQNASNSTNALQIENSAGGQIFNVDTTDSNLINNPANPSFEVNTSGWTLRNGVSGATSINRDTSQQKFGVASLKVTADAHTGNGARYTLASGTWPNGAYTVSFSMLNQGTAFTTVPTVLFGNGGGDNACSAVTLVNGAAATIPSTSGWTRYAANCTFTTSGTATNSIVIAQNEAVAHTWYIDAVQLETGGTASVYGLGSISLSSQIISPTTFKNQSNSTSAFQVQNNVGDALFGVDTLNTTVNLGEVGVGTAGSTVNIANTTGGTAQTVNIGSLGSTSATTIQGGNGSSAVILQAANNGTITIASQGSSTANTVVIGAGGSSTNTNNVNINNTSGPNSSSITIGGTAAYSGTITLGQSTTASNIINIGSGNLSSATQTINIGNGTASSSGGEAVNIANGTPGASTTNVVQIGTGGTTTGTVAVTIGSIGSAAHTTTIQAGTGGLNLTANGSSSSGIIAKTSVANSTAAFQVQNAVAAPIFVVDTTSTDGSGNQVNYLSYPGFESGSFSNAAAGWAAVAPASLAQNNNKLHAYNGLFSAQVTTTSSNGGLTTSSFAATPTTGTYIISFYAKITSGTNMDSSAFTVQTTDGATHTCSPATGTTFSTSTVGFQRIYCTITTTGTITALQITQNDGVARTIYIDAVQLQKNTINGTTITAPSAYQVGGIQLRGVITNPVVIQNNANSTSAFQVLNAAGISVLNVDTLNSNITVGSTSLYQTIATPALKGAADATGTNTSSSGTGSDAFNDITYYGKYLYIAKAGNATACASGAGNAIGCELQVYDATNPASPTYVAGVDASGTLNSGTDNSAFNGLAISGHYLYVAKANNGTNCNSTTDHVGCELQVYDISNPADPTYVGGADASGGTNTGTTSIAFNDIRISGNYVFIASSNNTTACSAITATGCELKVFSVANPAYPTYVGGADESGLTNSGTIGANALNKIRIVGRYAYVAKAADATDCSTVNNAEGCELQVYDISNPAAPTFVSGVDAGGTNNSVSGTVSAAFNDVAVISGGRYVYVEKAGSSTACSNIAGSAIGCETQIYDFSNPASPTYITGIDSTGAIGSGTGGQAGNNITVAGKYAYISLSGSTGTCSNTNATGCELQVYDVSSPTSPAYLTGMDATGVQTGLISVGDKQTVINGRYLYMARVNDVTDCSTAGNARGCELQIYDISGIDTVSLNAGSIYTGALTADQNAIFNQNISVAGGATIGQNLQVTGSLGVEGPVTLQNAVNSTGAFQIQNASAVQLFNADTTNLKLTANQANVIINSMSAPTGQATAFGANTGGSLSGAPGTTYFYKITALNAAGESLPSGEVSRATSTFTPLSAPSAPSGAPATGADLNVGNYLYELTVVTNNGESTVGTESAAVTTTPGSQDVLLTLPAVPTGATGFKVYRTTVGGVSGSEALVTVGGCSGTISAATCTDNATDAQVAGAPPGANTAWTDLNTISVSWTAVANATSYRIYRGTAAGAENAYQTSAASPFVDTGGAGTAASPPTYSSVGQLGIGVAAPTANLDVAGTARFKNTLNNTTSFQVQNSAGTSIFNVDTSNSRVGTAATSTTSTNSAAFTIRSGDATGATSNSGNVSIDVGTATQTAGSILIGTVNNANAITIGSTTQTTAITIGQATTASSQTINIESGNGTASTQTVNIGGGSSTTSGGKTVNIANGVPGTSTTNTVNIGTAGTTTGTVAVKIGSVGAAGHTTTIQGGNTAGAILLQAATSGTITIGNQTAATNNTIVIGDSGAAANTDNVSIGNTSGTNASTITIGGSGAASGTITLGQATTANNTISIGSGNLTAATQTINIGNGTSTTSGGEAVNIANGTPGTGTTNTINIGTGGSTTGTVAVSIGSAATAAHSTAINAGTGGLNFNLNGGSNTGATLKTVTSNSTLAFQIQNSTAQALFIADTANQRVSIGAGAAPATDALTIGTNTTTAAGGVIFGTDTSADLYRSGPGMLTMDGALTVNVSVTTPLIKTASGNLQIQPATGLTQFNTPSLDNEIRVYGSGGSNYATLSYNNASSSAILSTNSGTVKVGSGSGPINILAGSGAAVTITANAASTWSTTAGILTLQGAGGLSFNSPIVTDTTFKETSATEVQIQNGSGTNIFDADSTNMQLLVANTNPNASTTITVSATSSAGTTGATATVGDVKDAIAMGSDGNPRLAYEDDRNGQLKFIQCLNAACTSNNTTVLDSSVSTTHFYTTRAVVMKMASDGFARIAYADHNNNLKYVQCKNDSCSSNTLTTIAGSAPYDGVGMDLGTDGFARIAYYNTSTSQLTMVQCTAIDCSTAATTAVDTTTTCSTSCVPSLTMLASDGFARITYMDASSHLKFAQCTNAACSTHTLTVVDSAIAGLGDVNDITIASDGFARIAYDDNSANADLKFTQCTNAACSTHTITAITSFPVSPQQVSIAMGSDGFPRIGADGGSTAYFVQCAVAACTNASDIITSVDSIFFKGTVEMVLDSSGLGRFVYGVDNGNAQSDSIKTAQCTNTSCSTAITSLVTAPQINNVGQYSSTVLGTDGFARMSYYDGTNKSVDFMRCLNNACTNYTAVTIDASTANMGTYTSITLGSDGLPRIAYYDVTGGHLRLAYCPIADCTTVNAITADSSASVGTYLSMAQDADGKSSIAYYDATNGHLKVVSCFISSNSPTCGSAVSVDIGTSVGTYTSIIDGANGFPSIAYYDATNGHLKFVECAQDDCGSNFGTSTIDSAASVGTYTSMAKGSDGFPRITYYDATNHRLRFMQCTNASCSTNNINTVDSSADVGQYSSVSMGLDGFARISYYDNTNHRLKFAICTNATCTTSIISVADSSSANIGQYTSIEIGADGLARISYYDVTNTKLKFFLQTGTGAAASGVSLGTSSSLFANVNAAALQAAYALIKPTGDTTTAFQVQTSGGAAMFTVDTTDNLITIGTASSSPTVLVLGIKNDTSSDPSTCTNGGIYYNSVAEGFRGCVAGRWTSLNAGAQIDYAQATANKTLSATIWTDIMDGSAVTYDGNTTIKIDFFTPNLNSAANTGSSIVALYEDGVAVARLTSCSPDNAGTNGLVTASCPNLSASLLLTPTAGSHTFSVYGKGDGTSTAAFTAGTGPASGSTSNTFLPAYLRITLP